MNRLALALTLAGLLAVPLATTAPAAMTEANEKDLLRFNHRIAEGRKLLAGRVDLETEYEADAPRRFVLEHRRFVELASAFDALVAKRSTYAAGLAGTCRRLADQAVVLERARAEAQQRVARGGIKRFAKRHDLGSYATTLQETTRAIDATCDVADRIAAAPPPAPGPAPLPSSDHIVLETLEISPAKKGEVRILAVGRVVGVETEDIHRSLLVYTKEKPRSDANVLFAKRALPGFRFDFTVKPKRDARAVILVKDLGREDGDGNPVRHTLRIWPR